MDYSVFDSLLDSVFIINESKEITYCNEAAAKLCESSVRRLSKNRIIHEIIQFSDDKLFVMPGGELGKDQAIPFTELTYQLTAGKKGKLQIAIQPFTEDSEKRWVILIHDVTIEEVLFGKYRAELEQKEGVIVELQKAQKELEKYSKNLEQMVEERTAQVKKANVMLNAIMDSLGQGFLVFDESGKCGEIYTKACEEILESQPKNKAITEVLKLTESKAKNQFEQWIKAAFDEMLPFDAMKTLGPSTYQHSLNKYITLDYYPIRNEEEKINNLVLVATDKTLEYEANIALEKERLHAKMILKLITGKKQFKQFLNSIELYISEVKGLVLQVPENKIFDHQHAFRVLHTLEGEAGAFSAQKIRMAARHCQEIIEPLRDNATNINIKEIREKFLGTLMDLEQSYHQFLTENDHLFKMIGMNEGQKVELNFDEIKQFVAELKKKGADPELCEKFVDKVLKEPISRIFGHYEDVMQLIAEKQNKKVHPLTFKGGDIKVNPQNYEGVFTSLVHAFRNAMDHGIETPDERQFAGKDDLGTILIDVSKKTQNNQIWLQIIIQDDGRGINPSIIRNKLMQRKPQIDLSRETDEQVIQHIFDEGLTTKEQLGDFSGRGVGMDAIKFEVERIGGKIWVESTVGLGTKLIIMLPEIILAQTHAKGA